MLSFIFQVIAMAHEPDDLEYLTTYCFGAHYVEILLHDGYKFDNETWETISFQEKVRILFLSTIHD